VKSKGVEMQPNRESVQILTGSTDYNEPQAERGLESLACAVRESSGLNIESSDGLRVAPRPRSLGLFGWA